jgi:propanediol dehydratase large subunit
MADSRLAADTAPEIERAQIEAWRAMTPAQKAATVSGLTAAAFAMAMAGVRHRFPHATPHEQRLRLAIQVHGAELAIRAYPEAAALVDP